MARKPTSTRKSAAGARIPSRTHRPSALLDTRVIYCGDCLDQLRRLPDHCVDLIYIDPPFSSNRNYEVFWGETKEKQAFEDRHGSTQAYIDYMRPRRAFNLPERSATLGGLPATPGCAYCPSSLRTSFNRPGQYPYAQSSSTRQLSLGGLFQPIPSPTRQATPVLLRSLFQQIVQGAFQPNLQGRCRCGISWLSSHAIHGNAGLLRSQTLSHKALDCSERCTTMYCR
jgi:hypothetical protein